MLSVRRSMARLKFYFFPQFANDSIHLQLALATRPDLFSARLSGQNVSSRRLSRKVWPAPGNLRLPIGRAIVLEKIDLVARGQRRRSDHRPEIGATDSQFEAGPALHPDHDHHHRLRFCKSKRARLDRGYVQSARFLADYAARFRHNPA